MNTGFPGYIQLVNQGARGTVKDVRLRRPHRLEIGQRAIVTIEADSSLCDFRGIGIDPTRICTWVDVRRSVGSSASITVTFRHESGAVNPTLQLGNLPPGQGDIVFEACTHPDMLFQIGIPVGQAPLLTVAHPDNRTYAISCDPDWQF